MSEADYLAGHLASIRAAARRIAPHIRRTAALPASDLHAGLIVKPELLQPTGSFKVRGAFNAVLSLLERDPHPAGIIAVSSGNHGQAVALAARSCALRCTVVMPENSNPGKLAAVRALGAEVVSEGITAENREQRVLELRDASGFVLIHPFDAWEVIHGQGTIALELLDDRPDLGVVVCPVGGGGMVSGCALAVKARRPDVLVVAVEPELAGDAAASKRSGRRERLAAAPPTIADGLRSMTIGERDFEVIVERGLVDAVVTVSEEAIEDATVAAWTRLHLAAEPSGATALAGVLSGRIPPARPGATIAAVISGGNAEPGRIADLLRRASQSIQDSRGAHHEARTASA